MTRRSTTSAKPPKTLTLEQMRKVTAKAMLEAELQNNVRTCALANGWLFYHTHRSDKSDEGFPDCVMVRGDDMIVAELKREGKNPTNAQEKWLAALSQVNQIRCYVWRPMDWIDGTISRRLSR